MNLKEELAYIISEIKYDEKLKYADLINIGGSNLVKSQVTNILTKDGKGVDIERLYSLIDDLGYNLVLTLDKRLV